MAKFHIGGAEVDVDLPNFTMLKRAWSYVAAAQGSTDPMQSVSAILTIVALGDVKAKAIPADTPEADVKLELARRTLVLEEKMRPADMAGLRPSLNDLLIQIGLATPPGEVEPVGGETAENLSPATSTPSSAPSSPG